MSVRHDIYDPPPSRYIVPSAPREWPSVSRKEFLVLALMLLVLLALAVAAWTFDESVAAMVALGGSLVIVESWWTAHGFLVRRRHLARSRRRWLVYLAVLIPWIVGLTAAVAAMAGFFLVLDRL